MDDEILELITRRERQILVHSYIYYELNENIINDNTWSKWAQELARLIEEHPKEYKSSPYYKQFKMFNPSTGFGIYKGIANWAERKAKYLLSVKGKS